MKFTEQYFPVVQFNTLEKAASAIASVENP